MPCQKKEGSAPYLSGEGIMESVGSPEEEVNFNTPLSAPHTITYYSVYPIFLEQVENKAADSSQVRDNYVIEANNIGATEMVQCDEGGK